MSNRIKSKEILIGSNFVLPIEQSRVTMQEVKVRKIIEETDNKVKEILDDAENKSQIIVNTANTEAERIIEESHKKAQDDYDEIKQQAYNEGFIQGQKDGLEKFNEDAKKALQSLDTLSSSSFETKKNIIDSATLDIVELVSSIAEKVCKIKFDKEILYRLTIDAIKELNDKESITIIVNPELINDISELSPKFQEDIPNLKTIKILEDNSVSPDGVIVETLNTRLDSRVSSRIAEIARKMLTGNDDELE